MRKRRSRSSPPISPVSFPIPSRSGPRLRPPIAAPTAAPPPSNALRPSAAPRPSPWASSPSWAFLCPSRGDAAVGPAKPVGTLGPSAAATARPWRCWGTPWPSYSGSPAVSSRRFAGPSALCSPVGGHGDGDSAAGNVVRAMKQRCAVVRSAPSRCPRQRLRGSWWCQAADTTESALPATRPGAVKTTSPRQRSGAAPGVGALYPEQEALEASPHLPIEARPPGAFAGALGLS